MKKLFFLACLCGAVLFSSCTSPEDKAKGYAEDIAEAISKGDFDKAQELEEEYTEWYNGLSDEDKKSAMKGIMNSVDSEEIKEDMERAMDNLGDKYKEAIDEASDQLDDALDKSSEDYEEAIDKASDQLDDALDQVDDALDQLDD